MSCLSQSSDIKTFLETSTENFYTFQSKFIRKTDEKSFLSCLTFCLIYEIIMKFLKIEMKPFKAENSILFNTHMPMLSFKACKRF